MLKQLQGGHFNGAP